MTLIKPSFSILMYLVSIYGSYFLGQSYCESKYDHVWILGGTDRDTIKTRYGGCEINFNTNPPSIVRHTKEYNQLVQIASMSSKQGSLIFYSNGCLVINGLGDPMANGDFLNPGNIYDDFCPDYGYIGYQNMFSIPNSYQDSIFFLFHVDLRENLQPNPLFSLIPEHLYYTVIDMTGSDGYGSVTEKNIIVFQDTTMLGSSLSAVKHSNGLDWWIISPSRWNNTYKIVLIDEAGPHYVGDQSIGIVPDSNSTAGQCKFSPDGSMFAWYHPLNGLFLYNFNRHNAELYNFRKIEMPPYSGITGGLEFSPSGKFLYVNHDTSIFQLDMDAVDIQNSMIHIADYDGFVDVLPTPFFKMERTPDHRIFMSPLFGSQWLHVIQEPDKKGKACRFEQHSLKLPTVNNWALPHFPNYRLGPFEEPLCDSLWVSTDYPEYLTENKYKIGPNPTSGYLQIFQIEDSRKEDFEVSIIGMNGSLFLQSNENEMDLSGLPAGVYICKIVESNGLIQIEKIVVLE